MRAKLIRALTSKILADKHKNATRLLQYLIIFLKRIKKKKVSYTTVACRPHNSIYRVLLFIIILYAQVLAFRQPCETVYLAEGRSSLATERPRVRVLFQISGVSCREVEYLIPLDKNTRKKQTKITIYIKKKNAPMERGRGAGCKDGAEQSKKSTENTTNLRCITPWILSCYHGRDYTHVQTPKYLYIIITEVQSK